MKRVIKFKLSKETKSQLTSKGVYILTNLINGNTYVGSTLRDFRERFKEHCGTYNLFLQNGGRMVHPVLWAAFDKYGLDCFKAEILEEMNNFSDQEILDKEEYYIKLLKPVYNVAQEPSKGGSPNKDKKLSEKWKTKITEKSKLYKHDKEALALVTQNNKNNACKLRFTNETETLEFNSWVEAAIHFGLKPHTSFGMRKALKNGTLYKGYKIEKLTKQSKTIKLYYEHNEIKVFKSFNECDRFLNMWRGYTSTQYTRGKTLLKDKYKFEIL